MTSTAIEAVAGTVVSTAVSLGRVRVTRDRGYSRQGSVSVVRSEDGWPEDICLIFGSDGYFFRSIIFRTNRRYSRIQL